jgi:hypothetical protein
MTGDDSRIGPSAGTQFVSGCALGTNEMACHDSQEFDNAGQMGGGRFMCSANRGSGAELQLRDAFSFPIAVD